MIRDDFQRLATDRLRDAKTLIQAGRFGGAYYLSGYVIECALKACIAKQTKRFEFPDLERAKLAFQHDIQQLSLQSEVAKNLKGAPQPVRDNWKLIEGWKVASRYRSATEQEARSLYAAVSDRRDGVLQWLKHYW